MTMTDKPASAAPVATLLISVTLADGSVHGRDVTLTATQITAGDIEAGFRRPVRLVLDRAFDLVDQAVYLAAQAQAEQP